MAEATDYRRRYRRTRTPYTEEEIRLRREASGYVKPAEFIPPGGYHTRYTMNRAYQLENQTAYGPFYKSITALWPGSSTRKFYYASTSYRSKNRSARIHPNFYVMQTDYDCKVINSSGGAIGPTTFDCRNSYAAYYTAGGWGTVDNRARNKAASRLTGKIKDNTTAALAVTLAEWKQSHNMIATRAGQLVAAIRALKRGDLHSVQKTLQVGNDVRRAKALRRQFQNRNTDSVRKGTIDLSNLWLEFHFGWAPLLDDIQTAVKVLGSSPPIVPVRASGVAFELYDNGNTAVGTWHQTLDYKAKVMAGCTVRVSNPNLTLANQLGLLNPAVVAWELVPFSFLVDWFYPIGQFLDSYTDLVGYEIMYPFTTLKREASSVEVFRDGPTLRYGGSCSSIHMERVLSLPQYKLQWNKFQGLSVARGATAIALVIQQFLSIDNSKRPKGYFK